MSIGIPGGGGSIPPPSSRGNKRAGRVSAKASKTAKDRNIFNVLQKAVATDIAHGGIFSPKWRRAISSSMGAAIKAHDDSILAVVKSMGKNMGKALAEAPSPDVHTAEFLKALAGSFLENKVKASIIPPILDQTMSLAVQSGVAKLFQSLLLNPQLPQLPSNPTRRVNKR